jgi:hypothetical protein
MAANMTADITQDMAATVRPDVSRAPVLPPPCVYSPHGAPKAMAAWKAATAPKSRAAAHAAVTDIRGTVLESFISASWDGM